MSIATEMTNLAANRDAIKAAIEAKNPSVAPTSALSSFPASIASIPTGGGGDAEPPEKDVIFIDYDGTILYSYTAVEAAALTEMPELPDRTSEGLTCQCWNYTLQQFKDTVADVGEACIGAVYATTDGETRLNITVRDPKYRTVPLYFSQTASGGVVIDWGDGSATETISGTGSVNTSHAYPETYPASYTIALSVSSGTMDFSGNIFGASSNSSTVSCSAWGSMLDSVHVGSNVLRLGDGTFKYSGLTKITIPYNQSLVNLGSPLAYCALMRAVVIPPVGNANLSVSSYGFRDCFGLRRVSLTGDFTSFGTDCFYNCASIEKLRVPHGCVSGNAYTFRTMQSLRSMRMSASDTKVSERSFQDDWSLMALQIPAAVANIGQYAFYNCYGLRTLDLRLATAVPALASANAFSGTRSDLEIVVPDSLYASWTTATNWSDSSIVGKIVKASESSLGAL